MRYTKQAMTLAQQIQTLQSRGLVITDTNKAEQTLDAISVASQSVNRSIDDGIPV